MYVLKVSYVLNNDSTTRMGAVLIKVIQEQTWRARRQKHRSSFTIYTHRVLEKDIRDMEGVAAQRVKPSYLNATRSHDAIITALRSL